MTGPTMEDICDDYFASMSPIASKIIEEKRKCMDKNKKNWERLTQDEKDLLLDAWFIDPDLKIRYEIRMHGQLPCNEDNPPESFPRLMVQGGSKTVHHTEHEDGSQSKGTTITWKDEFSGPFTWETKCQQDLPMISPASVTAASNRNSDPDQENRLSIGLDANDESLLIVNPSKDKSKEAKRGADRVEKSDKTRVSRKDSKKRERAREDPVPVIQQQPKAAPAQPRFSEVGPDPAQSDKTGNGTSRREKSEKPKSPKSRTSGITSPKRESRHKDKKVDMEGLLPQSGDKEERSLEGINFSLGSTEGEVMPPPSLPAATFCLTGTSVSSDPKPSSPPPSATSQGSEQGSAAGQEEGGAAFDFLLSW